MRDPEYRRSLKDWESFVGTLTEKIIESDETIPELPLKDVIFRIYRDIRFSKDPTPYKVSSSSSHDTMPEWPARIDLVPSRIIPQPGRELVGKGRTHAIMFTASPAAVL